VGFEPTIPAFKRAKTVLALDCVATVMGMTCISQRYILSGVENYNISPLLIWYRELDNLMQRFLFYFRGDVTLTESLEKMFQR
jgi:hypothetical protein